MYYVKDLKTKQVKEYISLNEIYKDLGLKARLSHKDVERKRIVYDRYMLSDSLDFNRRTYKPVNVETEYLLEDNGKLTKYVGTLNNLAKKLGIKIHSIRQTINTNTLIQKRYRLYTDEKYIKPLVRNYKQAVKRKFFIFDLFFDKEREKVMTITELCEYLQTTRQNIHAGLSKGYKIKNRYYISYNTMKHEKFKKTNARLKKQKVDLRENGDFVYREPNKPVKRIGKLGVDGIKNRLKNNR